MGRKICQPYERHCFTGVKLAGEPPYDPVDNQTGRRVALQMWLNEQENLAAGFQRSCRQPFVLKQVG